MTIMVENDFHAVKQTALPTVNIQDEFSWIQPQKEGPDSKVVVGKHRRTKAVIVLKLFKKKIVRIDDFFREYHYNYCLSPHPNIINNFETVFQDDEHYVFALELAQAGDLSVHLRDSGLGEIKTKRIVEQMCSALEFIHSKDLVHGAICAENILVFEHDMSVVKMCDFGLTKLSGDFGLKTKDLIPWEPPEVCDTKTQHHYILTAAIDTWHLGILIYYCLTGNYPWFSADDFDPYFNDWKAWIEQRTKRVPENFKNFTPDLLRLLSQLLEPNPAHRGSISLVHSFLESAWLIDQYNINDLYFDKNNNEKSQRSSFDGVKHKVSSFLHIKK